MSSVVRLEQFARQDFIIGGGNKTVKHDFKNKLMWADSIIALINNLVAQSKFVFKGL